MKRTMSLALSLAGLMGVCFLFSGNLRASEGLGDDILWLTKAEVNEKFGKPTFLYCEEEPYRRYETVLPENEKQLRVTFLYDVIIHDLYHFKRNGNNVEYRIYYGEDSSNGKKTFRVKEYAIKFLDGPVALGKVVNFVPEFKPAYDCSKVFQERLFYYDTFRLIFLAGKTNNLSQRMGEQFTDSDKDIKDWTLAYDVMLSEGEPERVSSNSMVKEVIVSVDGEYRIGKTASFFGAKLIKNPLP